MGNLDFLREALICGYYDEDRNYIVEVDEAMLEEVVDDKYKDFTTNIKTKVQLYELMKIEFTKELDEDYNDFVVHFERNKENGIKI